jgi:hypothetical protein
MNWHTSNMGESLYITLSPSTDLRDTIWLMHPNSPERRANTVRASYAYFEDHSVVGNFKLDKDAPFTGEDYLLIDYVNADTTLLEGRFSGTFPGALGQFIRDPRA